MILMLTHINGEAPTTDRAQDVSLLKMKEAAYARAEQLQDAGKGFHIYVADEQDATNIYLQIFNDAGCLRRPGVVHKLA